MRNIFDQYDQPENRLTHALVCCLDADRSLMGAFISWATGNKAPSTSSLRIVEQSLPGEPETEELSENHLGRSLPDAWIYSDDGWTLLIESKVALEVDNDQLRRHLQTAIRRGFEKPLQVVLSVNAPTKDLPERTTACTWSELYRWAVASKPNEWAYRLVKYMEVAERKMILDGYLKEGTLTSFSGISFDEGNPYTYLEAKRLLQLVMQEVRKSKALQEQLGVDLVRPGRPAITGSKGGTVWDVLHFGKAKDIDFSKHPHLTFALEPARARVQLTIPNGIDGQLRRNFANQGCPGITAALAEFIQRAAPLMLDRGAQPYVLLLQRRYPSQRSEPFVDAWIEFDPRTAFDAKDDANVKLQVQWLEATISAMSKRQGNLNLAIGMAFTYDKSQLIRDQSFVEAVVGVWLATKPILEALGVV